MRLISISCVKNESDIIEAFIRHTAGLVDHLVVLDNGSTDTTLEILGSLKNTGVPMEIIEDPSLGKWDSIRMTKLMREVAVQKLGADWILPLDADEFILKPADLPFRSLLARFNGPVNVRWKTYIPDPSDDQDENNPVLRIRHRLVTEAQPWEKVIVPRDLALKDGVTIAQGNHSLRLNGERIKATVLKNAYLAHIPIRSPGQYGVKIALGYLQTLVMSNRNKAWNWHYNAPFDLLKTDPAAFAKSYRDAALRFAVKPGTHFDPEVELDPILYLGGDLAFTTRQDDEQLTLRTVLEYAESLAKTLSQRRNLQV